MPRAAFADAAAAHGNVAVDQNVLPRPGRLWTSMRPTSSLGSGAAGNSGVGTDIARAIK